MKSTLENMGHQTIRVINGCLIARLGDRWYSSGETVNLRTDIPRTLTEIIEFIKEQDEMKNQIATRKITIGEDNYGPGQTLWFAGDPEILNLPAIAVILSREVFAGSTKEKALDGYRAMNEIND